MDRWLATNMCRMLEKMAQQYMRLSWQTKSKQSMTLSYEKIPLILMDDLNVILITTKFLAELLSFDNFKINIEKPQLHLLGPYLFTNIKLIVLILQSCRLHWKSSKSKWLKKNPISYKCCKVNIFVTLTGSSNLDQTDNRKFYTDFFNLGENIQWQAAQNWHWHCIVPHARCKFNFREPSNFLDAFCGFKFWWSAHLEAEFCSSLHDHLSLKVS